MGAHPPPPRGLSPTFLFKTRGGPGGGRGGGGVGLFLARMGFFPLSQVSFKHLLEQGPISQFRKVDRANSPFFPKGGKPNLDLFSLVFPFPFVIHGGGTSGGKHQQVQRQNPKDALPFQSETETSDSTDA